MRLLRRSKPEPEVLAAVDLGSNSFHMIVMRLSHGQPVVLDRLREMVRLAAAIRPEGDVDEKKSAAALDCLARFGERLREIDVDWSRVVGTNTLRRIGRRSNFVDRASEVLGQPIEIISGIEEARLIYLGVSRSMPAIDGAQIVVDIGGGSTEIIRGTGFEPQRMESFNMGCVGLSKAHFGNGKITARRFKRARLAARIKLEPVCSRFLDVAPERIVGASGTIRAAMRVTNDKQGNEQRITRQGLEELIDRMLAAGHVDRLQLDGLATQRAPVFPGGVAILFEVMTALGAEVIEVSDGALREGLIYDMIGRLADEDARELSVRAMASRFHADSEQAARVEQTATALFDQVARDWKLDPDTDRQMLRWAAQLHEIGLDIAHTQYQQHGGYLLRHSNMPGFPTDEQQVLASLVEAHRSKLQRQAFDDVPDHWTRRARRLAILLRLAALFHRSRTSVALPSVNVTAKGKRVDLVLPAEWLDENPLTRANLEREVTRCADGGFELTLSPSEGSPRSAEV